MKALKQSLRREMKQRLLSIPEEEYEEKSRKIREILFKQPEWQNAKTVGITLSNFPEADTRMIIQRGWEEGKRIAVPKCVPETKAMDFYQIQSFHDVEKGFFGLLEPLPEKTKWVSKEEIDLLIVPGLIFSKKGYRIGFGGGYYDRYLSDFKGLTLALSFHEQIVENIPVEDHDLPVRKIVTDKGVILADAD